MTQHSFHPNMSIRGRNTSNCKSDMKKLPYKVLKADSSPEKLAHSTSTILGWARTSKGSRGSSISGTASPGCLSLRPPGSFPLAGEISPSTRSGKTHLPRPPLAGIRRWHLPPEEKTEGGGAEYESKLAGNQHGAGGGR